MKTQELMKEDLPWISPQETVTVAAELMAFHNVGVLPVCDADGRAQGVITDRDIALRVVGENRLGTETKVADVMTSPARSVRPDSPIGVASELMGDLRVERLLVLDSAGYLKGILSLADLISGASKHRAVETARRIYARELPVHSDGHPHRADPPRLEFFHGELETSDSTDYWVEQAARREADDVNRGNTTGFREFPG